MLRKPHIWILILLHSCLKFLILISVFVFCKWSQWDNGVCAGAWSLGSSVAPPPSTSPHYWGTPDPPTRLPASLPLLTQTWEPECGDGRMWVYALSCRRTPGYLWGSLSSYECPCVQGLWQHMATKATTADLEKDYGVKGKLFPAFGTKSPTFPFWTGSSNFV